MRPSIEGRGLRKGVVVLTLDDTLDDLASLDQLRHDGGHLLRGSVLDGGDEGAQVSDGVGHTHLHGLGNLVADVGIGDLRLGRLVRLGGVALDEAVTQGRQALNLLGSQGRGIGDGGGERRNISGLSTHSVHILSDGRSSPLFSGGFLLPSLSGFIIPQVVAVVKGFFKFL